LNEKRDTSQEEKGMIFALRKIGYSYRKISEKLLEWGFDVCERTVGNIYNKIESEKSFLNNRNKCGRN